MVFPPVHPFSGLEGVIDLSDLEFIRDRIKAGDWWEVSGNIDAVGNKIAFIPASGKTAFMYKGKITMRINLVVPSSSARDEIIADLKINGVTKDKAAIGQQIVGQGANNKVGGAGSTIAGRFNALGLSLVGDGVKEIAIENTEDAGSAFATMSGWIEDT